MSLSEIQSLRVAAALEHFAHRLQTLEHSILLKISVEIDAAPAQERSSLIKLVTECKRMSQEISHLCHEVEKRQSFCSLQLFSEKIRDKIELEDRKTTVMRQQQEIQEKTKEIKKLKLQQKKLALQVNAKKTMSEEKNHKKCEQIQEETLQTGSLQEEELEFVRERLREEERVHTESQKFLLDQNQEVQKELHMRKEQTQQSLNEKKQQLYDVSRKKTLALDKLMEMRRMVREMEQLVMEDKVEQQRLQKEQAKVTAATKVQAWWRGCMVRRGLGPFRKTEDNVKDKKKKKKGKKK
ncbi:IQ domain-containing protein G [Oryzias latipes]|uniref:IQ domain-containing protein G n=1 Tax=Oryzias latipes TaxID=8090 RepID=UPI0002A4CA3F|nr:IQ domain-containing protein G [Oryzias latipes]XP_020565613.1 IQ domain-containing protein G [Oryzias latipes]